MKKILEYEFKCPVCGSKFIVNEYLYDAPYVGNLVISSGTCPVCGYKWSDVRLAESKGPRRIIYRVEEISDLNALVVRASTATVKIPELGVEIIPSYASQGYITTVEGIILDVLEKTKFICSSGEASEEKCREKIELFKKALNAEIRFTVEIIDPMGVSTIVSDKAVEEPYRPGDEARNSY